MVSFVPLVLAQQDSGEEPPFELFLGGPDGDDSLQVAAKPSVAARFSGSRQTTRLMK